MRFGPRAWEAWTADSEAMDEVIEHVLGMDLRDQRVVIQEYGQTSAVTMAALRSIAAEVLAVTSYIVAPHSSPELDDLVQAVALRSFDAVAFTLAPAVDEVLATADRLGIRSMLVDALHTDVTAACVGPITARPLQRCGIPTVQPNLGPVGRHGPRHDRAVGPRAARTQQIVVAGHLLELGTTHVCWDGAEVSLTAAPMAVLRALATRPEERGQQTAVGATPLRAARHQLARRRDGRCPSPAGVGQ